MIRGKKVDQALADLEFSRKRIAQDVRKCVMSAVANAENNHDLDVNTLVVAEAYVGKNMVMKRFAARGRGRGFQILKPFSQITVVVRETEAEAEKPKKEAGKGKKAEAKKPAGKTKAAAAAQKEAE
jgi:large subunit ribosomal protein L22